MGGGDGVEGGEWGEECGAVDVAECAVGGDAGGGDGEGGEGVSVAPVEGDGGGCYEEVGGPGCCDVVACGADFVVGLVGVGFADGAEDGEQGE